VRVLISAISCRPDLGSEARVGWNAANAIAEGHECHVVTHGEGRAAIEAAQARGEAAGVTFHYLGEPFRWHPNRLVARLQSWLVYRRWQEQLLPLARELHAKHRFDLTHHVTYVTWRVPSPLWRLPVPFIWGPIGGTATLPGAFRGMLSPAARAFEVARDISGAAAVRSGGFRECAQRAALVLAANGETADFLAKFRPQGPIRQLPPVFFTPAQVSPLAAAMDRRPPAGGVLRLVAGGNLEGRKGVRLALRAIASLRGRGPAVHYTFAGSGPELAALRTEAAVLGIAGQVTFHPGFSGAEYVDQLAASDVYLLPSFRETTPITLLEAILAGCYPVVADASGAGEIVRQVGGHAVQATDPDTLVAGLADALRWCDANRPEMRTTAAAASRSVVKLFSRARYNASINSFYAETLDAAHGVQT
jgi:glycosyltransferase involved in cell wall biosynthesis